MKSIIVGLSLFFILLQYQLWFSNGGVLGIHQLQQKIEAQLVENQTLEQRNQEILADISDLKAGKAAVAEHARNDLGMVKKGETFYQILPAHQNSQVYTHLT